MPRALQHEFPYWMDDPHAEGGPGESRLVWPGRMRVVSARRARKLRKRGVPLMPLHEVRTPRCGELRENEPTLQGYPGKRCARYAWFEPEAVVEAREQRRAFRCYVMATGPGYGRKANLRALLEVQRRGHLRNVQLDLYNVAWRALLDNTVQHTSPTHRVDGEPQGQRILLDERMRGVTGPLTPEQEADLETFVRYAKYDT